MDVLRDDMDPEAIKEMRRALLEQGKYAPKSSTSTKVNEQYDFTTGPDIAHKTAQEISQLQSGQLGSAYDGDIKGYVAGGERLKDLAKYMNDAGYDPYSIPVIQQGRLASRAVASDSSYG